MTEWDSGGRITTIYATLQDGLFRPERWRRAHCRRRLGVVADRSVCDEHGNLWGYRGNPTTVLSAHLDSIPGCPGYDDWAGVTVILHAAEICEHIAWMLTIGEEEGQIGAEEIEPILPGVTRCVVLDRRGDGDCVHYCSGLVRYATLDQAEAICAELAEHDLHYTPCAGGISDARVFCHRWPTVNLSVGFSDEHTPRERLDISAFRKAFHAAGVLCVEAI